MKSVRLNDFFETNDAYMNINSTKPEDPVDLATLDRWTSSRSTPATRSSQEERRTGDYAQGRPSTISKVGIWIARRNADDACST